MRPLVKIAFFFIFLFGLVGFVMGIYLFNMQDLNLNNARPDFVITAQALEKEFSDNESASTSKYVNRIVEVTGTIKEIKKGEAGTISIILGTGNELSSVICTFADGSGSGGLATGKEVTIRGQCSGYLMDVLLNNCAFIKHKLP